METRSRMEISSSEKRKVGGGGGHGICFCESIQMESLLLPKWFLCVSPFKYVHTGQADKLALPKMCTQRFTKYSFNCPALSLIMRENSSYSNAWQIGKDSILCRLPHNAMGQIYSSSYHCNCISFCVPSSPLNSSCFGKFQNIIDRKYLPYCRPFK